MLNDSVAQLYQNINIASKELEYYCINNGLSMNDSKINYSQFLQKNINPNFILHLTVNGKTVESKDSLKFL